MDNSNTEKSHNAIVMRIGQSSDTGMVRSSNEDAVLALDLSDSASLAEKPVALLAIADGMGGCDNGEIASALALRVLNDRIPDSLAMLLTSGDTAGLAHERVPGMLVDTVLAANLEVFNQNQASGNGMGTTLVAALILGPKTYIANVGDSRAYLFQGDKLRQVTIDHSLVATMVSAGLITHDEIYTHPQRNIITRSLGAQPKLEADLFTEEVKPGDSVLLCSDGLWEMVRDQQIGEVLLAAPDPQTACARLVSLANRNGGADNISIIVVNFQKAALNAAGSNIVRPDHTPKELPTLAQS